MTPIRGISAVQRHCLYDARVGPRRTNRLLLTLTEPQEITMGSKQRTHWAVETIDLISGQHNWTRLDQIGVIPFTEEPIRFVGEAELYTNMQVNEALIEGARQEADYHRPRFKEQAAVDIALLLLNKPTVQEVALMGSLSRAIPLPEQQRSPVGDIDMILYVDPPTYRRNLANKGLPRTTPGVQTRRSHLLEGSINPWLAELLGLSEGEAHWIWTWLAGRPDPNRFMEAVETPPTERSLDQRQLLARAYKLDLQILPYGWAWERTMRSYNSFAPSMDVDFLNRVRPDIRVFDTNRMQFDEYPMWLITD